MADPVAFQRGFGYAALGEPRDYLFWQFAGFLLRRGDGL